MTKMALTANVDGTLKPKAKKALDFVVANAGRMIIAEISADVRTALQNRYLNGWVYTRQICDKLNEAGITMPGGGLWTRDAIHAAMQECFLMTHEYLLKGKHVKVFESTASMSRKRFREYVDDQIAPFVRELWNIEIEEPQDGFYSELLAEINSKRRKREN